MASRVRPKSNSTGGPTVRPHTRQGMAGTPGGMTRPLGVDCIQRGVRQNLLGESTQRTRVSHGRRTELHGPRGSPRREMRRHGRLDSGPQALARSMPMSQVWDPIARRVLRRRKTRTIDPPWSAAKTAWLAAPELDPRWDRGTEGPSFESGSGRIGRVSSLWEGVEECHERMATNEPNGACGAIRSTAKRIACARRSLSSIGAPAARAAWYLLEQTD